MTSNQQIDSKTDNMPDLHALAQLSVRIGSDPLLIQGAGGNTSIKIDDTLWVKASGHKLAAALEQQIFVPLNLTGIRRRLAAGEADATSNEVLEDPTCKGLRPSIETTLHALMSHKVVLHVHSVNAMACAVVANGEENLARPLDGLQWAWVPYARPGLPLTRNIEMATSSRPDILVLANHGLVLGADSLIEAESLLTEIESRIKITPRKVPEPDLTLLQQLAIDTEYKLPTAIDIHSLAMDSACLAAATTRSLYPDHVVFLGPGPLPTQNKDAVSNWLNECRSSGEICPPILLIPDTGVLFRRDLSEAAEEMIHCLVAILMRVNPTDQLVFLSNEQEQELVDWDAEKYRQSLTKKL